MRSKTHLLNELNIINWQPRHSETIEEVEETTSTHQTNEWSLLEATVKQCQNCDLHKNRTNAVFGVGNKQAKLMIIGEAPGFHEDQQGEPFVGKAGKLLTEMIKVLRLKRDDIYIANVLKCRPPRNRDPLPAEVASCTSYLKQQISLIQPALLVAVGRVAAHYLLSVKSSLESMRSKVHHYGDSNTPLIVTYHPAYLLRNPIDKRKAFADLHFIQQTLKENNNGTTFKPAQEAI